jgi:hypothetical protein
MVATNVRLIFWSTETNPHRIHTESLLEKDFDETLKISHTRSSRLNTRLVPYRHIEMCIEPCCTAASQIVQVILILQT